MTDDRSEVSPLRRIVVVGGGTAGWMAAAAMSKVLTSACEITLIESPLMGTVGVGEATVPSLIAFHQFLGIDETAFVAATQGTYKLGIDFRDWRVPGERYFHSFGAFGVGGEHSLFQSQWLRARAQGNASSLDDWSVTRLAAKLGRFTVPDKADPVASRINYAYHIDAALYAQFLSRYAQARGVVHVEGDIVDVAQDDRGFISALRLADGRSFETDLVFDCSGFRGLLIEQTLKAGFIDWSHWLPCDRAVAIQCAHPDDERLPYTQATALEAGWQWRIPLRHRMGNGYVYSSAFASDGDAEDRLMGGLDATIGQPRRLSFTAGRRAKMWEGNCVALGLASGFLEPLESTSIQLIQSGIVRFIELFPDRHCDVGLRDQFNRKMAMEYEGIRDFILLHYTASGRIDTPFWRHMNTLERPESLIYRQSVYERTGHIVLAEAGGFSEANWLAIYAGLQVWPSTYPPAMDMQETPEVRRQFVGLPDLIKASVARMPTHKAFLRTHFPG